MSHLSRFLLLAVLAASFGFAQGSRKIGDVTVVVDNQTIPVRISGSSTDLQSLALTAFSAHGRYDVSGRRTPAYEFKFTAVAANQVRLDITKGSAASPVASEIVAGKSWRHALLKAADVAVVKTNGLGLRGFFTARLAFLSQRTGKPEVCESDLFLREARQLTHNRSLALSPRWAPDGSRIIYTSYFKSGSPDIFLLDPVSGRQDTFASFRGTNSGARFSPNGQQVAMVLTGGDVSQIYISNALGRQMVQKTRSNDVKSSPCWSPDGTQLIFAMGEPTPQLYIMSAAGGAPRRAASGYTYMAEPDWSRTDRNKIACTVRVPGGKYQIGVVDLAGGTVKVVSKAAYDAVEPSWLGDGRHVVCTVRDRRTSVISILDTETGASFQVSPLNEPAFQAGVWTP